MAEETSTAPAGRDEGVWWRATQQCPSTSIRSYSWKEKGDRRDSLNGERGEGGVRESVLVVVPSPPFPLTIFQCIKGYSSNKQNRFILFRAQLDLVLHIYVHLTPYTYLTHKLFKHQSSTLQKQSVDQVTMQMSSDLGRIWGVDRPQLCCNWIM